MSADKQSPDDAAPWGRVADDGTVFVRTADGERSVGSYEAGTPEEALEFFTKRYDELEGKVHLLEQRVASGRLAPEEATSSTKALREQVVDAHAVGDLVALAARLDALGPVIAVQRSARKEERAQKSARVQGGEGEARRRGREAGRGHRLAQRRQPSARPARDVEGAAAPRPGHRRRAVAALLHRADDVHPAPQGALRRGARAPRQRSRRQGAAGQGGRGALHVDRVGSDRRQVPRPDARVEGRRAGAARGRRPALAALPRRAGHVLRRPRRRQRRTRRGVRGQRRRQGRDPGRGREAASR